MSRRRRNAALETFWRIVAGTCTALVVALVVLAVCPTLHAWLHGEKELADDDDCAVVLFANGVTTAATAIAVVAVFQRLSRERLAEPAALFFAEPRFQLPPVCGPPGASSPA